MPMERRPDSPGGWYLFKNHPEILSGWPTGKYYLYCESNARKEICTIGIRYEDGDFLYVFRPDPVSSQQKHPPSLQKSLMNMLAAGERANEPARTGGYPADPIMRLVINTIGEEKWGKLSPQTQIKYSKTYLKFFNEVLNPNESMEDFLKNIKRVISRS